MLRGHNVLCISSLDWSEHWQIHHELMSRLAADGNRVLYIENTGVRPPRVADLARVRRRIVNWWRSARGFRVERENLFVYSPLFLPFPYSRIAGWLNRVLMFRALARWMQATGFSRPIAWTFLPTPLARSLLEQVSPRAIIYYCADDFSASSASARRIAESEKLLIREADLVFATSERLRARAEALGGRVYRVPAGVDFDEFARVRDGNAPLPADLAALPRPVVGYIGALHPSFDQLLISTLAARLPHVSFALVGPAYDDVSRLEACHNVHLFGQRPHSDVPHYIKGFDVGIVPYRVSEYTASVYPVKLNEYLAMGIPVVATDIAEIRRFNEEHGSVIAIAPDAEDFAAAIEATLKSPNSGAPERRIEVARRNSWATRMETMADLVNQVLTENDARGDRWDERFARLYRRARRRTVQSVTVVVAAFLLLFYSPVVWWAAAPLRLEEPPRPVDAIVVFGGGVGESGQAGGGYQERVVAAVDLYRAGYARAIVFSSGFQFAMREAEVMRDLAVANGVPPDAVMLEDRAANTRENVLFTDAILREHGWRSILLVSSPYHMRRALLTWRASAPDVTVVPRPVLQSLFYTHTRGATLSQIDGILKEYLAIAVYWRRGWI
jgi:uncharacterized SAM-binding protein YcdF (DUF218 family)/glycosyltransferase involved in cell wall biosynthesis